MLLVTAYDNEGVNDYYFIVVNIIDGEEEDSKPTKLKSFLEQMILVQIVAGIGVAMIVSLSIWQIIRIRNKNKIR